MNLMSTPWLSRRALLRMYPAVLGSFMSVTCGRRSSNTVLSPENQSTQTPDLSPTPACGEQSTLPLTAGPFYTPDSPQRTSLLEPGITGTLIVLTGQVLSLECTPIAGALVDFWHTNDRGEYDNSGYKLRGHQFTDADGRYQLETIVPGFYPGRTRHFHVKVQAPNKPVLTTQLYFPEEPSNQGDFLFRPELLMTINDSDEGKQATFDFVLG